MTTELAMSEIFLFYLVFKNFQQITNALHWYFQEMALFRPLRHLVEVAISVVLQHVQNW
jgi:hypothetical protein